MRDQEWLECVIQIGDKFEVVNWHEGDELHVLNESPARQEAHISEEKHEELESDQTNHDIIEINCCLSHVLHFGVSVIKLHGN